MDTLSGISQEISRVRNEQVKPPVIVDVTQFVPGRDKTKPVVLQWRSPSVREVYLIGNDAAELLKDNMDWSEILAMDVATLSWCHVAPIPGDISVGKFYAGIANDNPDMFFYLITRLQQEFPHLKGTGRNQTVLIELCVQYLMRHPQELSHVPSDILSELQSMAEAKRAASVVI